MKANEITRKGESVYDYVWDEERVGFATTVDGKEIKFFPAKSKFDRSAANDAAKKLMVQTRAQERIADRLRREHEYQYNKPLSQLELEWVEMTKRYMSLTPKELDRWVNLNPIVRKSLHDKTHPAMKD